MLTLDALVHDDPHEAREVAARGMAAAADERERAIYGWARARAEHELGDVDAALAAYAEAVAAAETAGHREVIGRIRLSQALAQAEMGDTDAALASLEHAEALVSPDGRQRVLNQRALVLYHAGRLREAHAAAGEAWELATEHGDDLTAARATLNRGIVNLQMGDLDQAEADLERALAIATASDQELMQCVVRHDLALVAGRRGDIPKALREFDAAVEGLERIGAPVRTLANLERDRAECLLIAGLADEAAATAGRAEDLASRAGNEATAGEAALLAALAHVRRGDAAATTAAAARARSAFRSAERPGWEVYVDAVALEARLLDDEPQGLTEAERADLAVLGDELRRFGWEREADQTRVVAALLELAGGEVARAGAWIDDLDRARDEGPLGSRLRAWLATARLGLARGDVEAAHEAIERGMRIVEEHVEIAAAIDVRASVAAQAGELAALGLRMALDEGRTADAFEWADRWRASTLPLDALRSGVDQRIERSLRELRRTETELWGVEPGSTRFSALRREADALESDVRARSRALSGRAPVRAAASIDAVRKALGERTLVEYAVLDGALLALVLEAGGDPRAVPLGPVERVWREIDFALAGLHRLTRSSRPGIVDEVRNAMASLDALLVPALGLGPGPLVVVPAQGLHDVAWRGLPSLAGRPLTLAPSAAAWRGDGTAWTAWHAPTPDRVGMVAGPGLPGADEEVAALADLWGTTALSGGGATVGTCLELAAEVDLLHIAAHGSFRRGNAALTSIALADGALTLYDLARLPSVPSVVVLAACGLARSARIGDEVMGFAHGLLGLGARAVIAPVLAVPDQATARLMPGLHAGLRAGRAPAEALALLENATRVAAPAEWLALWGLACLGTR